MNDARLMQLKIDEDRQLYLNGMKINGVIDAGIRTDYKQLVNGEAVLNIQMLVDVKAIKDQAAT